MFPHCLFQRVYTRQKLSVKFSMTDSGTLGREEKRDSGSCLAAKIDVNVTL